MKPFILVIPGYVGSGTKSGTNTGDTTVIGAIARDGNVVAMLLVGGIASWAKVEHSLGVHGRRISTGRMLPSLHSGQRSGGFGCCGCRVNAASRRLGDCASSSMRHKPILSSRRRLARKPKWRILTKPRGSTWSRKRRMNSVACSVMMAGWLACV
jgi:hypothetical protein